MSLEGDHQYFAKVGKWFTRHFVNKEAKQQSKLAKYRSESSSTSAPDPSAGGSSSGVKSEPNSSSHKGNSNTKESCSAKSTPIPAPAKPETKQRPHTSESRAPPPEKKQSSAKTKKEMEAVDFFTEYGEANRYIIHEIIGKGSYGVVCAATDTQTGEKVAIKKITDVFEHVSDATRILREIKLLRHFDHPDIVQIKHIMLPPSAREFNDIYVVFELLETDLHQVIKANDDLTTDHFKYFVYQMLCGLAYVHSANVFHRDLKPKNILANADCKLKICDFGLARPNFNEAATTVFWTDYVATRWYRAPELCGSFFTKYTPAIDVWSIGCIFAEVILGKPLFPGRNVVHQLELITDLLGTPSPEAIAKVRNEKARRFLKNMKFKPPVPLEQRFVGVDPACVKLVQRLLAFDPVDRPTAEEALEDPAFQGLRSKAHETKSVPVSRLAFDFERHKLSRDDVRSLIYEEILEYHPELKEQLGTSEERASAGFMYPSAIDRLKREFAMLEEGGGRPGTAPLVRHATSLPRERVADFQREAARYRGEGMRGRAETVGRPSGQMTKSDSISNQMGETESSGAEKGVAEMALDN
eukprot:CAMPEP_0197856538 /NCGR_PEP_ID=MMETSP1438-20131217/28748_1 /TAXON_ID=1461541 /ORGANISM="Pterosperma sp., Strain CCMP1384" /LENGTH=583 /DNA_ID=CAMNT_0043472023 /DNA_START=235 /DNA_END=1986 /DNA_ORIENTATION=+